MKIDCYLTTAPRSISYIEQTCISLYDAGFDPHIFAEPHSIIPKEFKFTLRETVLGAWHNWKQATLQMISASDADFFLSCQDDISVHPEAKRFCFEFIERYQDVLDSIGYLSLYTPTHYTYTGGDIRPKPKGITKMGVPAAYGACCLLFPRKSIERMLNTIVWQNWLGVPAQSNPLQAYQDRRENPSTIKHVDAAITRMMIELKLDLMYPVPSICQHTGEISSIGHARAIIPTDGTKSRRVAQRLVDFTKSLLQQVFDNA